MKKLLCLLLVLSLLCSMPVFAAEETELAIEGEIQGSLSMERITSRLNPKRGAEEDNLIFPGPFVFDKACNTYGKVSLTFGAHTTNKKNQYYCMMIYQGSEPVGEPVATDYSEFYWIGSGFLDVHLSWEKEYAEPGQYTVVSFTADLVGETLVPVDDTASMAHIYLYDNPPIPEKVYLKNWETGLVMEDKISLAYGETTVLGVCYYPAISYHGTSSMIGSTFLHEQKVGGYHFVTPKEYGTVYTTYSSQRGTRDISIEVCNSGWGHENIATFEAGKPSLYMNGYQHHICGLCGIVTREPVPSFEAVYKAFRDFPYGSWYIPEVKEAVYLGLFNGVSKTAFGPEESMTRAMLVTVLWRYEGKPEATPSYYVDVPADAWYHAALDWATEQGIVNGVGEGKFDPEATLTREQIATILYRYTQKKSVLTEINGDPAGFPDASDLSVWAEEGMAWALGHKIINGSNEDGVAYLQPLASATRSQVSAIMVRMIGKFPTPQVEFPDLTDAIDGGKVPLWEGSNDYLHWGLYEDGLLKFSLEGETVILNRDYTTDFPWDEYTDQIRTVEVLYGVKTIGASVFVGYRNLETVILSESVTTIGEFAFRNCANLKEVRRSENLGGIARNAFEGCTSLQEMIFTDALTYLGDTAFSGCTSLKKVTFGTNLRTVEGHCFEGCTSLKEALLPNSVSKLGGAAFRGCTSLEKVTLPVGLKELEGWMFQNCTSLKEVELPYAAEKMGFDVMVNCSSLERVSLPFLMEEMSSGQFVGCTSLKEVYALNPVLSIFYMGSGEQQYPFGDPSQVTVYGIPETDVATIAAKHGYAFCSIYE